jgi:hypothetical protein
MAACSPQVQRIMISHTVNMKEKIKAAKKLVGFEDKME